MSEVTTTSTDEPLISLRPTTLIEKYIWSKNLVIQLINQGKAQLLEIGKLNSEKDELVSLLKDRGLHKDFNYKQMVKTEQQKNKELKKEIEDLTHRIAQLNAPEFNNSNKNIILPFPGVGSFETLQMQNKRNVASAENDVNLNKK